MFYKGICFKKIKAGASILSDGRFLQNSLRIKDISEGCAVYGSEVYPTASLTHELCARTHLFMKVIKVVMKNNKIKILAFCLISMLIITLGIGIYMLLRYQHTSAKRLENKYQGTVTKYISSSDKDGDTIDDQSDILMGALAYVETRPKYKSKYYEGGYPTDNYGVCTDVVARGFLAAGYDLQKLVDEDIKKNIKNYNIDKPDSNIDFRRVRNLKAYFDNNAQVLTTDVNKIEEWQGGDIVVFKKHIALVSDRRNKNGVPYIIHHNDPWQLRYEEDVLALRGDIVGHYRFPK